MKFLKILFPAVLLCGAAAGCGETGTAVNPKVSDPNRHAISPVTRPVDENVGPKDKDGKPRSLTIPN